MKIDKFCFFLLAEIVLTVNADDNKVPQFPDYPIEVSNGPFLTSLKLKGREKEYSELWKNFVQKELSGDVNYAGHYRIVLTKNGDFPIECSNDVWVCGRVIDKPTGEVVSELLQFNSKTQYYATIDNGTPVSDSFDIVFYAKSSMLWLYGMTKPVKGNWTETKCARVAYNFINNKFIPIGLWRCETDVGEEKIRILTCLDVFNYA